MCEILEERSRPDLTSGDIDALTAFLPRLEALPDDCGAATKRDESGIFPISPGRRAAVDLAGEIFAAIYDNHIMYAFDWPVWVRDEHLEFLQVRPGWLAGADLETIRRLLIAYARQEGGVTQLVAAGQMTAILRRLKALQREVRR